MRAAPEGSDRYGSVLVAIVVTFALVPASGSDLGRTLLLFAQAGTLLLIYRVSRASRLTQWILAGVMSVAVAVAGLALLGVFGDPAGRRVFATIVLLFITASPLVVARRLVRHERVTASTVAGALSIYLLAAEFFSLLYPLIAALTRQPFFAGRDSASPTDYVYFSLVTIATVGYGDFTAATAIGRMVAAAEGLMGQLYLVTVVALVVSNLNSSRPRRLDDAEGTSLARAPTEDPGGAAGSGGGDA